MVGAHYGGLVQQYEAPLGLEIEGNSMTVSSWDQVNPGLGFLPN
jgi:hypothetical protein